MSYPIRLLCPSLLLSVLPKDFAILSSVLVCWYPAISEWLTSFLLTLLLPIPLPRLPWERSSVISHIAFHWLGVYQSMCSFTPLLTIPHISHKISVSGKKKLELNALPSLSCALRVKLKPTPWLKVSP